jgi:hypothetical protein
MDGTTKQSALHSKRSGVECVPEVEEEDQCEPREEEGLGGGPVDFTVEGLTALRKPPAHSAAPHARVGEERRILY